MKEKIDGIVNREIAFPRRHSFVSREEIIVVRFVVAKLASQAQHDNVAHRESIALRYVVAKGN